MKATIQDKRRVFDGHFKIDEATVSYERFDGRESAPRRLLCFERGDSVAVLIYNRDTNMLLLTKQFRFPTFEKGPGWLLEIVAGTMEDGEDPEEAVRREVPEETGYQVQELKAISTFYTSPGGSSERIHLYFAEVGEADRVSEGGGLEEEGENIETVALSLGEFRKLVEKRELQDAKSLIAALWFFSEFSGW